MIVDTVDEIALYQKMLDSLNDARRYLKRASDQLRLVNFAACEKLIDEAETFEKSLAKISSLVEEVSDVIVSLSDVNVSSKDGWIW